MFTVIVKRKIARGLQRLPQSVQNRFLALVKDLEATGPAQPGWMNYSPLGGGRHHCHLGYHHAACWYHADGTITIEVYYVGSREGAPY